MKVQGKPTRSLWVDPKDPGVVRIIDQRFLPHKFVIEDLRNLEDAVQAIAEMQVRGAPLIGVAAAYGVYLALLEAKKRKQGSAWIEQAFQALQGARPTAVNPAWALEEQRKALREGASLEEKIQKAFQTANQMAEEDVDTCRKIGVHGLKLIQEIHHRKKGKAVNILTHCNAGWLACIDWGTATAPIYLAFEEGIPLHVWVSETRPRNQGASLTAWELGEEGISHTVIADNAAGHLMQHGKVDLVLVGSDRTTRTGDVANKIGTYLKALAAKDNAIPFYAALPSSSIDWNLTDGFGQIPIEERSSEEVKWIAGLSDGKIRRVLLTPKESAASNYGFDVTPSRLVTGLITERGVSRPNEESLFAFFPEKNTRAVGI